MDSIGASETANAAGNSGLARFPLKFYYAIIGGAILVILLIIPLFKSNYITYVVIQMVFFA